MTYEGYEFNVDFRIISTAKKYSKRVVKIISIEIDLKGFDKDEIEDAEIFAENNTDLIEEKFYEILMEE